jgi:hypothetical protein
VGSSIGAEEIDLRPRSKEVALIRFLKKVGRQLPVLRDIHRYILALEAEREELRRAVAAQRDELAKAHETTRKLWVPPGHPHSPIPDLDDVRRRESELFGRPPDELPGLDTLVEEQLTVLREMKRWGAEPPFPAGADGRRSSYEDPAYGWGDIALLHAFLRKLRPRRVVCAGAGPFVPALLDLNEHVFGRTVALTVVDPDAEKLRPLLKPEEAEKVRLLPARVHEVPFDTFTSLSPGDVLCLETSHVSRTGSDLNHLLFRVLPRLKGGVHVHPNGIFWPFEYPSAWVTEGRAWNEAYLWRAFLLYNGAWEISVFASFLESAHRSGILKELPQWQRSRGGGLWLKKRT